MKKNLFFLLGLGLFTSFQVSAQLTYTDIGMEAQHADITVMDWDNDGDLDLLVSGESGGALIMNAYLNNGTGTYTSVSVPFTPIARGSFDWNDVNMDGNPDLLMNGFGPNGAFTGIYNSNGTGTFTVNSLSLPQMSPTSGFGDFNNDGYVDIYVFGNEGQNQGKSKLLINDKAGGFVDNGAFANYSFTFDPDVTVVDFDNDKDLDMFVNAGDAVGSRYSRMLVNNGSGVFTEMMVTTVEKGYGSSVWGDYDGDGYLDLLFSGSGTPAIPGDNYRLFKNNNGASFSEIRTFGYGQYSTGDGGRFLDWDNDGDLDIIVTGWTGTRQATDIYINTGGIFTESPVNASTPGVSESSIEVADVDNDSDLDLFITGFSGNDFDGGGTAGPFMRNVTLLINNPTTVVNVAPTSPSGLSISGNQAALTLSWNAGGDINTPQASLSYNLFVVDQNGKWFYYPLSDTSTGKLKLQRLGNVNLNKSWTIKGLPAGTYRWGVQAIDNSFMGSAFAKSSFTINADGTLPVVLSKYSVTADGKKSKIEWATASEQNNSRFTIERSSNGREFFKLATVEGRGTVNSGNNYVVYDNNPSSGINYYRLTQYDIDGRPTNYGIKTVNFGIDKVSIVTAYPNPVQSKIGIRLSNYVGKRLDVSLIDMSGKVIHREVLRTENGQGYYSLHMANKPTAGQYMLQVIGEELTQTLKVIVK